MTRNIESLTFDTIKKIKSEYKNYLKDHGGLDINHPGVKFKVD